MIAMNAQTVLGNTMEASGGSERLRENARLVRMPIRTIVVCLVAVTVTIGMTTNARPVAKAEGDKAERKTHLMVGKQAGSMHVLVHFLVCTIEWTSAHSVQAW